LLLLPSFTVNLKQKCSPMVGILPKAPFNVASSTIDPTLSKLIDLTIVVSADYFKVKDKNKIFIL